MSWMEYEERLKQYFIANKITTDDDKKANFLTQLHPDTYHMFRGLTSPPKPKDKSFTELVTLMNSLEEQP